MIIIYNYHFVKSLPYCSKDTAHALVTVHGPATLHSPDHGFVVLTSSA